MLLQFKNKGKANAQNDSVQKHTSRNDSLVIVPRIKTYNCIKYLENIEGMTDKFMPIYAPLVGDLIVTYSVDVGSNYISITPDNCEIYGINPENIQKQAIANVQQYFFSIKTDTDGHAFELIMENDMEACAILFPQLWTQISEEIGDKIVAIYPSKNDVLYTRVSSKQGIETLKEIVDNFDFNNTHSLSKKLYLFSNSCWSVYHLDNIRGFC